MKTGMRKSRVLGKLRAGKPAYSFKLNFSCARSSEMVAMFGFDCVWIDVEHIANDWSVVEKHIWAAKSNDTDVMVRVSKGSYSDYIKPLELDAAGIMVPHVMSGEEAQNIAAMTRFHPSGRRPIDGGNSDAKYLGVDIENYTRQANEERFIAVQIEDPEGIRNLADIARVPGIDMLFFGPGDYSHRLGLTGQTNHPEVQKAREKVVSAALANGKFAGTVGNPDNCGGLVDIGYRLINIGADVAVMRKGLKEISDKLNLAP